MEIIKHVDWQSIRNALIFLGISALIGVSVAIGASIFLHKAQDQHDTQQRRLDDARRRYGRLDIDAAMVDAYSPHFQRFVEAGLIGEEQQLGWLAALRSAARRIGLPELRYSLSARKPYAPDSSPADPYRVYVSEMQLTMGLLHEGDLLSLFAELDRGAIGLYRVEYCGLRRVDYRTARRDPRAPAFDPNRANLDAECTLRWYTLERDDGTE
uniref:Uncharacterized protein n=1 Tax=Candidatus Kentrum sp. UNK TaxID=2126344 RepID=A0A451ASW7_9GAMM|nr:MAG: hypothetical protein BECKUNK1418G_GA0071005_101725 [Candidatus Kentron sp. UNK]VFK69126.1 MAG: hypothetical protein BECKUNK1418H_GA0071006_101044 [Candidatus Kentron sp. UNK]